LWRAAYAEFVFSSKLWPDWTAADLDAALAEFTSRKRNFGKVMAVEVEVPSRN
jgi:undecaprenyl diphosphate synthase